MAVRRLRLHALDTSSSDSFSLLFPTSGPVALRCGYPVGEGAALVYDTMRELASLASLERRDPVREESFRTAQHGMEWL